MESEWADAVLAQPKFDISLMLLLFCVSYSCLNGVVDFVVLCSVVSLCYAFGIVLGSIKNFISYILFSSTLFFFMQLILRQVGSWIIYIFSLLLLEINTCLMGLHLHICFTFATPYPVWILI